MPTFLSPAWVQALDAAARGLDGSASVPAAAELTIEQEVTGPDGTVTFHVSFHEGRLRVGDGPAPGDAIRFSSDRATAWALSNGDRSAQGAFMAGDLRVGGDLRGLLDHQDALAGLADLFAEVRAQTTFDATTAPPGPGSTDG